MIRLPRYLLVTVIAGILLVLLGLTVLFDLFTMLAELEHLGEGSYGLAQMFLYIALITPRQLYELMPTAGLIGTLIAFGGLSARGELVAMRAAGVSHWQITGWVVGGAGVLFVAAWGMGEWLAPAAESYAQEMKNSARGKRLASGGATELWVRDGKTFINLGGVTPDGMPRNLQLYAFDDSGRMRSSSSARGAEWQSGGWVLEGIDRTELGAEQAVVTHSVREPWDTQLSPDLFRIAVVDPRRMSVLAMKHYSDYLQENGLAQGEYRLALWSKLLQPLNAMVMVLLALPLAVGFQRTVNAAQRLFLGVLLGLGFHILNQSVGYMALAYQIPLAVVLIPTFGVGGIALYRLARQY